MTSKSYRLVILVNGRMWEWYDHELRDEQEAIRLADELSKRGALVRLLSTHSAYDLTEQLWKLNTNLLQATIPGIDVDAPLEPDDVERLYLERGYGCDRDVPYVCSLSGFDATKLIRLFGRVARGELIDDMIVE